MFIKNFSCVIICQDCGAVRQKNAYLTPFPITELYREIIDQAPHCISCNSMNIVVKNIECQVLSNYGMFGSRRHGEWECAQGHFKNYYPVMLERAFAGEMEQEKLYQYAAKYIGIRDLGYPPKCVVCKQKLIYHERGFTSFEH